MFRKSIFFIFAQVFLASCGLFETRTPEPPNTKQSSFQPPYAAVTVISNLIGAISEKNVDNYIACFSDTTQGDALPFVFIPSQEAMTRYPSLFNSWTLLNERRYLTALVNATPQDSIPTFSMVNQSEFDFLWTDSAMITSKYSLKYPHNIQSNVNFVQGTLQFVIYRRKSGWWTIHRWLDTKISNDSTGTTWSIMKAQFN